MSDIIVIGGGIAGVSAAARLAPHGTVTVLEGENALGYHASGRSAALFEANYGLPPTVALSVASADYHRNANGGYLSPRGLLILAQENDDTQFEADRAALDLNVLSPSDACELVPILNKDKIAQAGYHAEAWDVDTDRMIQDFARTVRQTGGRVLTGETATHIIRDGGQWIVTTNTQEYRAGVLINAAGAWADTVARMAGIAPLGIIPHRRSMARLPAPGGHDVSGWPIFFGTGESWYAKPDAGKLLVSPADEDPVEPHDAYADDMVLAEGLARYEDMVTTPVTRVETNWAGLRSFAPDRTLVLGRDPVQPDFVWCAAQGGYGFQTAPAASQLVADLVTGAQSELDAQTVAALSPARFS